MARTMLRILHVLRAPVGGLFRHVVDLASGQAARGHQVGVIADASTGGAQAEAVLADLAKSLALGLSRVPMSRGIGLSDLKAVAHVGARIDAARPDVVHGHGAKGGAYARLARGRAVRAYTPHGGSLHYRWATPAGAVYLGLERVLMRRTDLFLFESTYSREVFRLKIGDPGSRARVVHNGVRPAEFAPVAADPQAADLVFVGELRRLKGVDVLIEAIAALARGGRPTSAVIVGDGPDRAEFEAMVRSLGLDQAVRLVGAKPARAAFALGRLLIVPSRAESLPYIVLEAGAAGMPMIATDVGGIPEIFGPDAPALVPPGDASALARAIIATTDASASRTVLASRLQARLREGFSTEAMTNAILAAYAQVS
jgi:glycosyltransferase involved in cell wall biosynthesis